MIENIMERDEEINKKIIKNWFYFQEEYRNWEIDIHRNI